MKTSPQRTRQQYFIGPRIRTARQRAMTQKAMAQALKRRGIGIYQANLSRIENGIDDPQFSTVMAICQILGIEIADLVGDGDGRGKRRLNISLRVAHFLQQHTAFWQSLTEKEQLAIYPSWRNKIETEIQTHAVADKARKTGSLFRRSGASGKKGKDESHARAKR